MTRNRFLQSAIILGVLGCGSFSAVSQVAPSESPAGINKLNHIIFMAQENRSLDHYFGELRQYWADNGYADRSFNGLPQFNPPTGLPPLYGPPPTNPGCDPAEPPPKDCTIDANSPKVESFELITQCTENTSPSWNEAHVDWDYYDPMGKSKAKLNGFVYTAAHDGRVLGYNDSDGIRAMGYFDGTDLNSCYFMASNFATSDSWFNPAMARTHPNREYLVAATSQGDAYPVGTDGGDSQLLTAKTIFQELEAAHVSWKIYVNPTNTGCTGPPYNPACLLQTSYIKYFKWGQTIPAKYPKHIGTVGIANSDFENDLKNGTLPAVAQIEPATDAGLDEHPSTSDSSPSRTQNGALYVSGIINSVMGSSVWKDSAFILTYDEFGGIFDHVSPHPAVSPDGIKPKDLLPGDICNKGVTGPTCDFVYTGYRVPLIVVSPYTKKHYVSHTAADLTAILKLVETRFKLPPLTNRDAAQMDMTEFFDFAHPAWLTPPTPPVQNTSDPCYLNKLP
jgi:phospholipase C